MTPKLLASFALLCSLHGIAYAADAAASAANLGRRAVTTVYITTHITSTITKNPSDPTVWVTVNTITAWPFTTTSITTSDCINVRPIFLPPLSASESTTSTVTRTITERTTITEVRTDIPTRTWHEATLATVSKPTGRTVHTITCTNTAVDSYYPTTTYTSTITRSNTRTTVSSTEVCLTSTTRWLAGPSVTFVRPSTTKEEDNLKSLFTDGTTLITFPIPTAQTTWVITSTDTVVETTVICNNPTTRITETYFTLTRTVATETVYWPRTDCSSGSPTQPTPTPTPAQRRKAPPRPPADRDAAGLPAARQRAEPKEESSRTPVAAHTITVTSSGLLSNGSSATITRTGVVETHVQTFTTMTMVGATMTKTATRHVSVCSLPATAG